MNVHKKIQNQKAEDKIRKSKTKKQKTKSENPKPKSRRQNQKTKTKKQKTKSENQNLKNKKGKIIMARYTADEAKSFEYQGTDTFRIENDGGRKQVVFLYTDERSVGGWAVHRLPGKNFYTYTVDCPRKPKDEIDLCPACKAGEQLYSRLFVRMLDLSTGKVTIWDKPSSFRQEIVGFMHYFKPLYTRVYEVTRNGIGLKTEYKFQSLNESGIDEKKYKELVKEAEELCDNYVRPIDSYADIKAKSEAAKAEAVQVEEQSQNAAAQNAWGQNQAPGAPQQGWGAPPQQGWGAPSAQPAPQQGWGAPPQQPSTPPQQPAQAPQPAPQAPQGGWQPQAQQAPQGWGATPQGAWTQNPQN